jgi:hypothetical protein
VERIDDDWLKGEVDKKQGLFPASHVEIISGPGAGVVSVWLWCQGG